MTPSSASDTFQRGVQNLQAWLDYLDSEEAKLQAQLFKMQGGTAIPEIDADLPDYFEDEASIPASGQADAAAVDDDDWM
jgi:hypothetical protein